MFNDHVNKDLKHRVNFTPYINHPMGYGSKFFLYEKPESETQGAV